MMGQSISLLRSLGVEFGYYDTNDYMTAWKIDSIIDAQVDVQNVFGRAAFGSTDKEKEDSKNKLINEAYPTFLKLLESRAKPGKYIAETDTITIADFMVIHELWRHIKNPQGKFHAELSIMLNKYPKVNALCDRYEGELADYFKTRPVRPF